MSTVLDEEVALSAEAAADHDRFTDLVRRLSRQSVAKHYDAYADIPWDEPAYVIDSDDPRWELSSVTDPLGATDWYRAQPAGVRSRIGLYRYAAAMKTGLEFENVLKRGLLEFAFSLPNGDPMFRYAYHEVIEEAHHGLMFQEFVNRSGFDPPGLRRHERLAARRIVQLGRSFPELFFVFVIGGEDPIDHLQREALRGGDELHPLFETIMRHHVTEEARHLSFARHYLKLRVPQLSARRRARLSLAAPTILGEMSKLMMQAPADLVERFAVPAPVLREAYVDNPAHRANTQHALRKVRRLCRDTGLVNPLSLRIWRARGIWADD